MFKLNGNFKIYVFRYFHTFKRNKVTVTRQLHNFTQTKLLGKYLFLTNTISSGILMAVGDGVQQQIEFYKKLHRSEKYDWIRTMNMTIVGLVLGSVQHYFYGYIDKILPARTVQSVVQKIFLDQIIASPGAIIIFFYGLGLLENGNFDSAKTELKQKFLTIYLTDWIVWPPTQYLNFAYLSAKYRVVYINFVTALYDVFLSYVKYDKELKTSCLVSVPDWMMEYANPSVTLAGMSFHSHS